MTREEASFILANIDRRVCDDELNEALDIAIKALEHPEKNVIAIVPCEDAISRQAVKDMLMREWTRYIPMDLDVNLSFVLAKVGELPPVTPLPKIGKWYNIRVQGQIDDEIIEAFACSRCNAISVFRMTGDGEIVNGDFCPNCRAKMQEVEG